MAEFIPNSPSRISAFRVASVLSCHLPDGTFSGQYLVDLDNGQTIRGTEEVFGKKPIAGDYYCNNKGHFDSVLIEENVFESYCHPIERH